MLTAIHPKLPMRNKAITKDFYINQLGFTEFGYADFPGYLMVQKDSIEIHFFDHHNLDPLENYGQVYIRTNTIETLHQTLVANGIQCTALELKPWRQKEFSVLDPDHNLLTFGE
jgi:hypothetical protein